MMWKAFRQAVLHAAVLMLVLAATEAAAAQSGVKLEKTPKTFQTFFAAFKAAVRRKQKATVASMTEFPFDYGFDAGDEGKYTRTQFIKNFTKIFGSEGPLFDAKNIEFRCDARECVLDDMSDASHFIFKKRGKSYKFATYLSEP